MAETVGGPAGARKWASRIASFLAAAFATVAVMAFSLASLTGASAPPTRSPLPSTPPGTAAVATSRPPAPSSRPPSSDARRTPALSAHPPTSLRIPSIGVDGDVVAVGLADGEMDVPAGTDVAGWFTGSVSPGAAGSSVLAGHVTYDGPALFHRLDEVRPGSRLLVRRSDDSTAVFAVTRVRSYPKRTFPTRLVYGSTARPTMRLITCDGWDDQTQTYTYNLVVFAELVGGRSPH